MSRPATDQTPLIDAIRAAEGALGQAQTLLDAVDSASTDINHAVDGLPAAIADIQNGIDDGRPQGRLPTHPRSSSARDAARRVKAVADAQVNRDTDPLGAFPHLTKADADLDRMLSSVGEQPEAAKQGSSTRRCSPRNRG